MRRLHRPALLAAVAAGVLLVVAPVGARADEPTVRQAWSRTGLVPTFVPEADRLYVATDAGIEQARAFLGGAGGEVALAEATGGVLDDGAALLVCPLTSPLVGDGELSADAAPTADCAAPAAPTRGDGSWTVALPPDGFGVALVPDVKAAPTFRVSLDAERTALRLAAPAAPAPDVQPAPAPDASADPVPVPAAEPTPQFAEPVDVPLAAVDTAAPAPVTDVAEPRAAPSVASPGIRLPFGEADSPSAVVVLGLVALGVLTLALRRRGVTRVAAAIAAVVVPAAVLDESTVYRLGLVLIVLVGAIGLHLLVNWAGELSLAHATMIGLPAFAVAKISADAGLSPIVLLPLGIVVGAVAGAVVGLPATRAKGLQVALVTLAGGVAIDRFFFTKSWLIGDAAGAVVEIPTLGPLTFATARSLYPVLALAVIAAIVVARSLHGSSVVRAMLWVKADPAAASAFGVPVGRYRSAAYVIAGAFAGLAGGLTAMWVQRLTPQAFPLDRSFAYLTVVVLAGRGLLGGVALAAALIEGGRLFLADGDALMTYLGPVGLLLTLTTNRGGLNGLLARIPKERLVRTSTVRPLTVVATVVVAVGLAAIALAWYHSGNTNEVWVQNQELISGGIGGLALVLIGVGLYIGDRWDRLTSALLSNRVDET